MSSYHLFLLPLKKPISCVFAITISIKEEPGVRMPEFKSHLCSLAKKKMSFRTIDSNTVSFFAFSFFFIHVKPLLHSESKINERTHVKRLHNVCHMPTIQSMAITINEYSSYPDDVSGPTRIYTGACPILTPIISPLYNTASDNEYLINETVLYKRVAEDGNITFENKT